MSALFDMYKVDFRGPAIWLGSAPSYRIAALEIELSAARAPSDYAIVNRQTGERTVLPKMLLRMARLIKKNQREPSKR
jgi:hypothetical protein